MTRYVSSGTLNPTDWLASSLIARSPEGFINTRSQWRRQLWGTETRAHLDFQQFHFSSLWSKSESRVSKYCAVCEISWCRCQQLTSLSISACIIISKLLLKQAAAAPGTEVHRECLISIFAPPRNKSQRICGLYETLSNMLH